MKLRIAGLCFLLAAAVAAGTDLPWTQLGPFNPATGAPVFLSSVVAVPDSAILYAAGSSGVFRSDDGGAAWIGLGQPGGGYASELALDPSSPGTVYAATDTGVFRTADRGATWVSAGLQDQNIYALALDPTSPRTLYAGTWSSDPQASTGRVFKSLNAGATWTQIHDLRNDAVVSLAVDTREPSTVFAGTLGGSVLRSGNGGETWTTVDSVAGAVQQVVADPVRSGVVYSRWVNGQYVAWGPRAGSLRQSQDRGATWSDVAGLPVFYAGPFVIDPGDANVLYSINYGSLYRSTDGGASWDVLANAIVAAELAVSAGSPQFLYAAGEGVQRLDLPVLPPHCEGTLTNLCLQFGRFSVRLVFTFELFGLRIPAQAVPVTTDSGYFWFFGPENVELMVKVLDGTGINGNWWMFSGALSNVAYTLTVTDTLTGETKDYVNPGGTLASIADTQAFPDAVSANGLDAQPPSMVFPPPAIACESDPSALCLEEGRFHVRVAWQETPSGPSYAAVGVPLTTDTGYFWFFDEANAELVVKVLDGTAVNRHHWVFYGALSDVQYTITVTDTLTGVTKVYENPPGTLASVADTAAFPE